MAGQGRSLKQWNALSRSQKNRWKAAYGGEQSAVAAYRKGAKLTGKQRGHAATPERPMRALQQPWKYPGYVATHTKELNELARQRGLAEHGQGPRGESKATRSYKGSGGDFTWVLPEGVLSEPDDGHWVWSRGDEKAAQLAARRTTAPAGVVMIVDTLWVKGLPRPPKTPNHPYRYQLWFLGSPTPGGKGRRKKKKR